MTGECHKGSPARWHDSMLEWYRNPDIQIHSSWSTQEDPSTDWFEGIEDGLPGSENSSFSQSQDFWQTRPELVSNIQEATAIPVHEHHYSSGIQLTVGREEELYLRVLDGS